MNDPYSSFSSDACRLEALRSRDRREVTVALIRAGACVALALALIAAGKSDVVAAWLAGLGAALHLR